jgi:lysophospholipase L1-like esterase
VPISPASGGNPPASGNDPPPTLAVVPPYFYGDAGAPLRYLALGDSMTAGLEGGTVSYPVYTANALGSAVSLWNYGRPGETLSDIVGYEGIALQTWGVDGGINVVTLLAGTNDMHSYDAGPGDCYANLITFGQTARAAGWFVVVMTLPRPDAFVPAAMRAEYNTRIRQGWPTFADALVDLDADPALAAMTIGDAVHPNVDGHQRIAARVAPVVASLFARGGARFAEADAGALR